ncbi:MAG: hypothetical protein ACHP78_01550 [Terriglobales bacterium]
MTLPTMPGSGFLDVARARDDITDSIHMAFAAQCILLFDQVVSMLSNLGSVHCLPRSPRRLSPKLTATISESVQLARMVMREVQRGNP